jgi:hypothetical protein
MEANRTRTDDETVVKTNQPGTGVGAGGGGESSRRPPPAASAFSSDVGGGGPLSAAASPGSSDVSIFVSAPTSFSFSGVADASASPIVSRPPSLPLPHHSNIMLPRVCPAEVCAEIESEEPCAPPGPWVATRRTRARRTRKSERPSDSPQRATRKKKRQKVQNVRDRVSGEANKGGWE